MLNDVPNNIDRDRYDVLLREVEMRELTEDSTNHQNVKWSSIFLCSLIEILAETLPLVYDLRSRSNKDALRRSRWPEARLDEWKTHFRLESG